MEGTGETRAGDDLTAAQKALVFAAHGHLDDEQAERLMQLFKEMNRLGTTVIVATHNDALVQRHGAPALRLTHGRLAQER